MVAALRLFGCLALLFSDGAALAVKGRAQLARRRIGLEAKKKGFGTEKKKKSRTVLDDDYDVDDEPTGKPSEMDIFAKYGVKTTGPPKTPVEPVKPFEPLEIVPPNVQVGIEKALLGGVLAALFVFVMIGFAITAEAFAVSSKQPLPPDIQKLIVETLEPAFSPTLLFGLGCSVSLGLFKSLQLTSDSGQYSEE
ncbi:hypothetical protein M885DRAFT_505461 [Pelagophyceae sp. CCMP2097]|nr:hypothetical protein M885DRAFT_505461 [Pelagophyceae sp. CCMP2097]|mmetsp:Transcript_27043/g.90877  ORF Transcript_27043/g.90877 Transcript_27043/m.90877 type:complete len:194 (+) Transcript_27043:50-631(+)